MSSQEIATVTSSTSIPACWKMYRLPPFYSMQPVAGTWQKQLNLWSTVLVEYASIAAALRTRDGATGSDNSSGGVPYVVKYTVDSSIFASASLQRRLDPEAIVAIMQHTARTHPSTTMLLGSSSSSNEDDVNGPAPGGEDAQPTALLVAAEAGGMHKVQDAVLTWVLDMGAGTTKANLATTGAVFTIDEMVEGTDLTALAKATTLVNATIPSYIPEHLLSPSTKTHSGTTHVLKEAMNKEQLIRALLDGAGMTDASASTSTENGGAGAAAEGGVSADVVERGPLSEFRVTLFNLDGSDTLPYQGVKIGGEE